MQLSCRKPKCPIMLKAWLLGYLSAVPVFFVTTNNLFVTTNNLSRYIPTLQLLGRKRIWCYLFYVTLV